MGPELFLHICILKLLYKGYKDSKVFFFVIA